MEKKQNGEALTSNFDNKIEFKIPEWNLAAVESIKNTELYKNSVNFSNSVEKTEKVMFDRSIDTHGWDTVSVCRASALNTKILAEKNYPKTIKGSFAGTRVSLNAELGAWQIIKGGGGASLNVNIPIKSGMFYGLQDHDDFDITGSSFDLQINLEFFPLPSPEIKNGTYKLCTATEGNRPIIVLNFNYAKGEMDTANESLISGLFKEKINSRENLDFFDTIFSTVLIQNQIDIPEGFQWLNPTQISYGYSDGAEGVGSFAVMCMTGDEKHDDVGIHEVPSVPLESDQKTVFVISRECFVTKNFFTKFREYYNDEPQENFILGKNKKTVTAFSLPLKDVEYCGISYHPVADEFEIVFDDSLIRTQTKITCKISPGIRLKLNVVTNYELVMSTNDKGEKCMAYQIVGEPVVDSNVEKDKGVIITEIILGIAGFLISAISYVVIGAIVSVTIAIITAIAIGVMAFSIHYIIDKLIAEGITKSAPSIDPMVSFVSGQVEWPFCSKAGFTLTNIQYEGGIIFEGELFIDNKFKIENNRLMCA